MADEQKPEGPVPPSPKEPGAESSAPAKPPEAAKPAAPAKPAAAAHAPPKPPPEMAATPWEGELPNQIKERFNGLIIACSTYLGQSFVVAKPEAVIPLIEFLKLE